MREKSIERAAKRTLRFHFPVLKVGHEGWPDDLVLLGRGRHVWLEFKTPKGRLRPAQERRIRRLRQLDEPVAVVTSAEAAYMEVQDARIRGE